MTEERAIRYNGGKPQLSYLLEFPNAIKAVAAVAEMGANKYVRHNWKKGFDSSSILDSLLRHLVAYQNGEDIDPESGLQHLGHAAWNVLALIENQAIHPELDNRYKLVKERGNGETG